MKSRSTALTMILLVLISTLGLAVYAPQIAAEDTVTEALDDGFLETPKNGYVNSTYNVDESSQVIESFSKQGADGAERAQNKTLEGSRQTSRDRGDNLIFNDPSRWSDLVYVDGNMTRLVIGVNDEKPTSYIELEKITGKYQAKIVNTVSIKGEIRAAVVELPLTSVTAFVEEARIVGLASYIEPSMKVQIQLVPNDPYWSYQWGPQKIEADWAWNTTIGDPSILVAIVDTGVDYTHPDLAANYVPLGYDWANNDTDPVDDHGHGTHVSGTIAAVINNGVGIAGLAQVRIMAEKVLDSGGWGSSEWVASGVIHAVDQGADIISMSIGGYGHSELVYEAVTYAYDSGVLVIAAAGNDNTDMKLYPAGYDEVVAVAATDQLDNKAWFSNWGDWIELAAPGIDIYSTVPWGYESASGTSMATPHVSGVAALVWSRFPNKTRDWVRLWLRYAADDLGDPGFDVYYGYGRINARKAVEQSPPSHELIAYEWRTPPYVEPASLATVNATVLNFGENNETDIVVQLLANDTMVNQVSIGFLASGETAPINLTWNPVVEGLYNVTLYVVPVAGEVSVDNNVLWKYIYVGFPVKAVVLHSAGNTFGDIITNWQVLNTEWLRFGDTMVYIDYTTLNIEDITYEDLAATESDVLIISSAYDPWMGWQFTDSEIDAIKRYVFEGHGLIATAGTLYDLVPNNNKLASLFGLNETTMWSMTGTDLLHLLNATHPLFKNVPNPFIFADVGAAIPFDGLWDSNELTGGTYMALGQFEESAIVTYRGLVYISPWLEIIPAYYQHNLQLLYNAITWSRYQKPDHELVVSLESPARLNPEESTVLNATVSNLGRSNETDVDLHLLINGTMVDNATIPELLSGSSYMLSYLWTPTVEGIYNVTAYAPPMLNESFTANNIMSKMVYVRYVDVALISDYSELLAITSILDSMGIGYDIYNDNSMYLYTEDISLLLDYPTVIFYQYNRLITSGEHSTLQSYLSSGGNLLVTGYDSLGSPSDPLLADVVRSSSTGDNTGEPDLYVVDATHPIMNGPYGSFPAGYHITGLYSDNDAAEADTARMAVTVAELADGYDKIIATEVLPGKVVYWNGIGPDDWTWNADSEAMFKNTIVWFIIRYEHELTVSLDTPTFLEPGDSSLLNATVYNRGLSNETDVELQLLINGSLVRSETIPLLENGASHTIDYLWTPTIEALYNVTAYAPPMPDENITINNIVTKIVYVRPIKYVLFDQTHGTDDISYYSTWVTSLTARGYVVDVLTISPVTPSALDGYDVFVIPQAHDYYSVDELSAIHGFVAEGGGLLVIGDDNPSIYNDLTEFAGISWMSGGTSGITTDITPHEVTEGVVSVYLSSPIAQMQTSGASQDLVRDPVGGIMLSVSEHILGKVLGFADENSLWNNGLSQEDNLQLANNMIDWLTPPRYEHGLAVSVFVPALIELGDSTMLDATVINVGLNNETGVELYMLINGTVVGNATIDELLVGEFYTINYLWTPTGTGNYNVTAYAPPMPGEEYIADNVEAVRTYVFFYTRLYLQGEWVGGGAPMGWNADDASWNYTLPFDFPFYGIYYETIYISSNGLITFLGPDSNYSNSILALAGRLAIAVAWDDWVTYDPYDIYIWQNSSSVGIRWYARHFGTNITANFEAILSSNGTIQLNYAYNDGTVSATIGISNGVGHILAEDTTDLNYINTIVFAPFRLEHDVAVLSVTPSAYEALVGDPVDVTVAVENQGNFNESFTVSAYASSLNSTRIYFDPSNYMFNPATVSIGYRFNATVWVEDVADLFAWQVHTFYNDTVINATRWFEPTWDPTYVFYGKTTLPLPTPPDVAYTHWGPDNGSAMVGTTLLGSQPTFTGTGLLFILEFEITAVPPSGETLSSNLDIDNEDTVLLNFNIDEIPDVHKENGYYELGPDGPPPPNGWYKIGTKTVTDLAPGTRITLTFTWNTTGVIPGVYVIRAEASVVPGETDTTDNTYIGSTIKITKPPIASFTYSPSFPKPVETVTFNATSSTPNGGTIISYNWSFGDGNTTAATDPIITHTYASSGLYNVTLTITDSEGLTDSTWKTIYVFTRDTAIVDVTPSTDRTYIGRTVSINVTMLNEGEVTETFDVILYYNITAGDIIGTRIVIDLLPGEYRTLTFLWNTTGVKTCHNYTITAYTTPVLGETDIADNTLSSPTRVKVKLIGDINGDGKVDIQDIATVALAFGSYPSHLRWNPDADLNGDGQVDIIDIAIVAIHFGETS